MSKLVYLDVGGIKYQTYQSTLTMSSKYFECMLLGPWKERGDSEDNPIFIDRDGNNFRHILAYLRDPNHQIPRNIEYELDYYQIDYDVEIEHPTMYEIIDQDHAKAEVKIPDHPTSNKDLEVSHIYDFSGHIGQIIEKRGGTYSGGYHVAKFDQGRSPTGIYQTRIPVMSDWVNDLSLEIDFEGAIDLSETRIDPNYWKYHYLERIEFKLSGNEELVYRISGQALWLYDQIHRPWRQIRYDQLMEQRTGQYIYRIPKIFFPLCNHLYYPVQCSVHLLNNPVPPNLSLHIHGFRVDDQIRRMNDPMEYKFHQFIEQEESNFTPGGTTVTVPLHNTGCLEKFYLMVKSGSSIVPIKRLKIRCNGMLFFDQSERLICQNMADRGVYPNNHVYLIDFKTRSESDYISDQNPTKQFLSLERLDYCQVMIEFYQPITENYKVYCLSENLNLLQCHQGLAGLRLTYQ